MFRRTETVIRFRKVDGLLAIANELPEVLTKDVTQMYDRIESGFLEDVQYEPPKPAPDPLGKSNSLRWTSGAQQKAFHGTKGFGRGIPTSRNEYPNRLVDQITIRLNINPKSVSITVRSLDERTVHVFGPLDDESGSPDDYDQETFLNDRGWERIAPKVRRWRQLAVDRFRDGLIELVEELRHRSE